MPDQTAYLRANAVTINEGWEVSAASAGSLTIQAAVGDNNVNTWAFTLANPSRLNLSTADVSLPAGAVIKAAQAVFQMDGSNTGYAEVILLLVWVPTGNVVGQSPTLRLNYAPFFGTLGTPAAFATPDGAELSQNDVNNNFWIQVQGFAYGGGAAQLREAWLQVTYNVPPTATPNQPVDASTATATALPLLGIAYGDADGDPQEAIRFKVFSGTGAVANPDAPTPTELARLVSDSGDMFTSAVTWSPLPLDGSGALANGSYRWYVKARDAGSHHWGAWGTRTFTINVAAPPAPTVTSAVVSTSLPGGQVVVTLAEGAGSPVATQFEARRSVDGGTTWQVLRPSLRVARTGSTATIIDRDAPRGAILRYAVRALGEVSAGVPRPPSAWSASVVVTNPSDGLAYVKTANGSHAFEVKQLKAGPGWTLTWTEDMEVVPLATQDEPVVLSGRQRSPTFEVTFAFLTDAAWRILDAAWRTQQPMLLQTCYGDITSAFFGQLQFWVRLGPALSRALITTDAEDMGLNQRSEVTVGAWVVAEPD